LDAPYSVPYNVVHDGTPSNTKIEAGGLVFVAIKFTTMGETVVIAGIYGPFDTLDEGIRYARDRNWPEFQVVVLTEV
jgi:hypothetical protein